jgi:translation initiation factor IF-1
LGTDKTLKNGAGGQGPESGGQGPGARGRLVAASVLEERPSAIYVVLLEKQQRVLAHLVGAVKRNFVRLVPGDRVEVELSPHDPTRGRVTRKLTGE